MAQVQPERADTQGYTANSTAHSDLRELVASQMISKGYLLPRTSGKFTGHQYPEKNHRDTGGRYQVSYLLSNQHRIHSTSSAKQEWEMLRYGGEGEDRRFCGLDQEHTREAIPAQSLRSAHTRCHILGVCSFRVLLAATAESLLQMKVVLMKYTYHAQNKS